MIVKKIKGRKGGGKRWGSERGGNGEREKERKKGKDKI